LAADIDLRHRLRTDELGVSIPHPYRPSTLVQGLPGIYFGLILIVPLLSEAGVLILAFLGAGALIFSRANTLQHLTWQRRDTWISLCIASVFLFKMASALWSGTPYLAVRNALWHTHLLLWPLVLIGLHRCNARLHDIEKPLAWGLILTAIWYGLSLFWATADPNRPFFEAGTTGYQQLGQLTLVLGSLNFVTLTRPGLKAPRWLFAWALLATVVVLHATSRRIEMAAFAVIVIGCTAYRLWYRLSKLQVAGILAATGILMFTVASLRSHLYMQALQEATQFMALRQTDLGVTQTSIGGRLEMYRLGLMAVADKPWLGWGAGIRPHHLGQFGAPPPEMFTHRHFHSEYLQTLVEGGIIWAVLLSASLAYLTRQWIVKPAASQRELVLMAAAVMLAYAMEGLFSSALVYGPSNGLLVVCTAWIWGHLRKNANST
jgi:O-antigen ligase